MSGIITSAYDDFDELTVDQAMKDPTFIPGRVKKSLENAWLEDFFFRKGPSNNGVVAFREEVADNLTDEGVEEIAEFGEIPVISPDHEIGAIKAAFAVKSGAAFRVSYEQRTENNWDAVNRSQTAVQKRMLAHGIRAIESVFNAADIPEIEITTPWAEGGNIVQDISDGMIAVQGAHEVGNPLAMYNYNPNAILYHPTVKTTARLNESIQKYFIGNMADKNPVFQNFRGLTGFQLFGQLQEAESLLINPRHIYIFERGTPGFVSDTIPLTQTPLYSEGGDSPLGGPSMSWRSDFVRKRAIAVDNPMSIVRLVLPDA